MGEIFVVPTSINDPTDPTGLGMVAGNGGWIFGGEPKYFPGHANYVVSEVPLPDDTANNTRVGSYTTKPVGGSALTWTFNYGVLNLPSSAPPTLLTPTIVVTWDFGDGSPPETGLSVTHTFPEDNYYIVTMYVEHVGKADSNPRLASKPTHMIFKSAITYAITADTGITVLDQSFTKMVLPNISDAFLWWFCYGWDPANPLVQHNIDGFISSRSGVSPSDRNTVRLRGPGYFYAFEYALRWGLAGPYAFTDEYGNTISGMTVTNGTTVAPDWVEPFCVKNLDFDFYGSMVVQQDSRIKGAPRIPLRGQFTRFGNLIDQIDLKTRTGDAAILLPAWVDRKLSATIADRPIIGSTGTPIKGDFTKGDRIVRNVDTPLRAGWVNTLIAVASAFGLPDGTYVSEIGPNVGLGLGSSDIRLSQAYQGVTTTQLTAMIARLPYQDDLTKRNNTVLIHNNFTTPESYARNNITLVSTPGSNVLTNVSEPVHDGWLELDIAGGGLGGLSTTTTLACSDVQTSLPSTITAAGGDFSNAGIPSAGRIKIATTYLDQNGNTQKSFAIIAYTGKSTSPKQFTGCTLVWGRGAFVSGAALDFIVHILEIDASNPANQKLTVSSLPVATTTASRNATIPWTAFATDQLLIERPINGLDPITTKTFVMGGSRITDVDAATRLATVAPDDDYMTVSGTWQLAVGTSTWITDISVPVDSNWLGKTVTNPNGGVTANTVVLEVDTVLNRIRVQKQPNTNVVVKNFRIGFSYGSFLSAVTRWGGATSPAIRERFQLPGTAVISSATVGAVSDATKQITLKSPKVAALTSPFRYAGFTMQVTAGSRKVKVLSLADSRPQGAMTSKWIGLRLECITAGLIPASPTDTRVVAVGPDVGLGLATDEFLIDNDPLAAGTSQGYVRVDLKQAVDVILDAAFVQKVGGVQLLTLSSPGTAPPALGYDPSTGRYDYDYAGKKLLGMKATANIASGDPTVRKTLTTWRTRIGANVNATFPISASWAGKYITDPAGKLAPLTKIVSVNVSAGTVLLDREPLVSGVIGSLSIFGQPGTLTTEYCDFYDSLSGIAGPNPDAGGLMGDNINFTDATYLDWDSWHGVDFGACKNITLRNMSLWYLWGDFFFFKPYDPYGQSQHQSMKGSQAQPDTINIHQVYGRGCGRHAFTWQAGVRLDVDSGDYSGIAHWFIDNEPLQNARMLKCRWANCAAGGSGSPYHYLSKGPGSVVNGDVPRLITGVQITQGSPIAKIVTGEGTGWEKDLNGTFIYGNWFDGSYQGCQLSLPSDTGLANWTYLLQWRNFDEIEMSQNADWGAAPGTTKTVSMLMKGTGQIHDLMFEYNRLTQGQFIIDIDSQTTKPTQTSFSRINFRVTATAGTPYVQITSMDARADGTSYEPDSTWINQVFRPSVANYFPSQPAPKILEIGPSLTDPNLPTKFHMKLDRNTLKSVTGMLCSIAPLLEWHRGFTFQYNCQSATGSYDGDTGAPGLPLLRLGRGWTDVLVRGNIIPFVERTDPATRSYLLGWLNNSRQARMFTRDGAPPNLPAGTSWQEYDNYLPGAADNDLTPSGTITAAITFDQNPHSNLTPVTYTVTLTSSTGDPVDGYVSILETTNASDTTPPVLNNAGQVKLVGGVATFTTAAPKPDGTYYVRVRYNGGCSPQDQRYQSPTATTLTVGTVATKEDTITTATASPNPPIDGQPASVGATVTGITSQPTGTVRLSGTAVGTPVDLVLVGGQVSLNRTFDPGTYTLLAEYLGDNLHNPSSSTITFTVEEVIVVQNGEEWTAGRVGS
jgi:hypothetical protein